jgi:hypothetical protein
MDYVNAVLLIAVIVLLVVVVRQQWQSAESLSILSSEAMLDVIDRQIDHDALYDAATEIYEAGHWTCDRRVDEKDLWENLRDALHREPGHAPKPIKPAPRKKARK